jgi:hypothetical protein
MELDQRPASDYQVTVRLGRRAAQLEPEPLVELEGLAEIPARHDRDGVLGHGLTVLHPSIPQGQDTHQRDEGEKPDEVADPRSSSHPYATTIAPTRANQTAVAASMK